jgi:integrase
MAAKNNIKKIAAFVDKYSNKGTGAGYKGAIEGFLRCIFGLQKMDNEGHKITHDYETLFDQYLSEKKRDKVADITAYSECLVRDCVSHQSARQQLTYAVKFLRAHGINILKDDIQDIKRECKGGAATIDKVMDHNVICKALKGSDIRSRALVLTLASSGLRIGELLSIKMSDIDMNLNPCMINVRAEYAKNGHARYTFISTEARDAIFDYLKVRDEYIARADRHSETLGVKTQREADLLFPVTDSSVNKMWETLLKNAGLYTRDEKSGRNQYRIHSLRKFFISQLSMAGARTLAEHLAGHTGYLDASYRQVSPEFAAREYLKLQSVLIVCIPENIKAGIKMADEKIGVLMEKTELQTESIEGMKIINAQLRQQMAQIQEETKNDMAAMREQMGILTDTINTIMETMVTPGAKLALKRDAAEGAAIAEPLLKQSPGKRTSKK